MLKELGDKETDVTICNALALEMDEMWSFYHDKKHQIWLWWAVEHSTNTPVAFTFGTRENQYLDELLKLLKPFNIKISRIAFGLPIGSDIEYADEITLAKAIECRREI